MSQELRELLYEAINTPLGVVVETDNPIALKQKLYTIRKEDEAFAVLSFNTSRTKPATEIWIVRKPNAG